MAIAGEVNDFTELTRILDEETASWSSGFSRHIYYEAIQSQGASAVPKLIEEVAEGKFWVWRTELICSIARDVLDRSVYFEPAIQGRREPVVNRVVDWWQQEGRAAFAELDPSPGDQS